MSAPSRHFRAAFLALAVVALFALLMQPVCEAYEAHAGDTASCCLSIDEAPAPAVSAVSPGVESPTAAVAVVQLPAPRLAALYPRTKAPPDLVRAALSYHSRSARNLS